MAALQKLIIFDTFCGLILNEELLVLRHVQEVKLFWVCTFSQLTILVLSVCSLCRECSALLQHSGHVEWTWCPAVYFHRICYFRKYGNCFHALLSESMFQYYWSWLTLQAQKVINAEQQVLPITTLIQQLVRATLPQTRSLLPNDLKASVRILTIIIETLESNYNGSDVSEVSIVLCWL